MKREEATSVTFPSFPRVHPQEFSLHFKKIIIMHACLVNNAYIVLSAQEYVENLEGCEALADRLARPSQTGQEEVCHIASKFF